MYLLFTNPMVLGFLISNDMNSKQIDLVYFQSIGIHLKLIIII